MMERENADGVCPRRRDRTSPPTRIRSAGIDRKLITRRALLSTALGAACLAGCFSTPAKQERFYFLNGPSEVVTPGRGPRIAVAAYSSNSGFDTSRLAYRVGKNELRYYGYRKWIAEPAQMLRELTIRYLAASRRFSQVDKLDHVPDPQAVIGAHVTAIEEVDDLEEERWYARLAMSFSARREGSNDVLLRHAFDVTLPCKRRDPAAVANALSRIFAKEIKVLIARLSNRLRPTA